MNHSEWRLPEPGEAAVPLYTPEEQAQRATRDKKQKAKKNRAEVNRKRWQRLNAFTDGALSSAGPSGGVVWLCLFRFAKPDGTAFASLRVLEGMTGLDRRTIQRAVTRLVSLDLVEVTQRGGGVVATQYRLIPTPKRGCQNAP